MQLKTRVKVNSVTNLSDARYFATFAEWAGFNFNPNDAHYVSLITARELIGWMSGPRIIGEFGTAPLENINKTVEMLSLDSIQTDYAIDYKLLTPQISSIIRQVFITPMTKAEELTTILLKEAPYTAYFLLNFTPTAHRMSWDDLLKPDTLISPAFLKQICADYNILLQLPFSAANVLTIVNELAPAGIALDGGMEIKTGIRSFDEVADLIELLEV